MCTDNCVCGCKYMTVCTHTKKIVICLKLFSCCAICPHCFTVVSARGVYREGCQCHYIGSSSCFEGDKECIPAAFY